MAYHTFHTKIVDLHISNAIDFAKYNFLDYVCRIQNEYAGYKDPITVVAIFAGFYEDYSLFKHDAKTL